MLKKKRIIVCICFVLVGIGAFKFMFFHSLYLTPRLIVIEGLLSTYISENNGEFPGSRKALEEGEIIKETRNQDGSYSIRVFREKGKWAEHHIDFYRFQIAYGTDVNDLGLKDGILIDLTTGEPAYLITGPLNFPCRPGSLRRRYQMISRKWYEEMCQYAKDK